MRSTRRRKSVVWAIDLTKLPTPGGAVRATPLYADGVLYVGTDSGALYALKAATGKEVWTQPFKVPNARFLTTPLMQGGLLLVAPAGSRHATVWAESDERPDAMAVPSCLRASEAISYVGCADHQSVYECAAADL